MKTASQGQHIATESLVRAGEAYNDPGSSLLRVFINAWTPPKPCTAVVARCTRE